MDIYGEVVPELNSLYRTFYDLQKMLFKITNRQKKFNYEKLAEEAEKTHQRVQEINQYINTKEHVNPLLIDFAYNLEQATVWMYIYLSKKFSLEGGFSTEDEIHQAFNELFSASRRMTKSAKKIS